MVASEFHVVIVTPDEVLFEGDVSKLLVPGIFQELAILPDHTPLYAQLTKGIVQVNPQAGSSKNFEIEGGIIRVKRNSVSILVGFDTKETVNETKN